MKRTNNEFIFTEHIKISKYLNKKVICLKRTMSNSKYIIVYSTIVSNFQKDQ